MLSRTHVAFRTDPATPPSQLEERIGAVLEAALSHHSHEDELHWAERELWWLPRVGVSTSDLRVRRVEQALGVTTMRTHRAVAGLAAKHLDA